MRSLILTVAPLLTAAAIGCISRSPQPANDDATSALPIDFDTTGHWYQVARAWSDESQQDWTNDSLRMVLLDMEQEDQSVRRDLTPERLTDSSFIRQMHVVDSANSARLRAIVARFGWPGRSLVGARGASAAWKIVQHSPEMQEEGERWMLAALPGEVSPTDLAMLIDRRLVKQGQPQRYGTQLSPDADGTLTLDPIEDPAGLAARRDEVGLPPLADYLRMIERMYQVRVVDTVSHPSAGPRTPAP
jgi:hypothetical protein